MPYRISVDTGGTFTDVLIERPGEALRLFKSPTVPDDPAAGVLAALRTAASDFNCTLDALLAECNLFLHGTTTRQMTA